MTVSRVLNRREMGRVVDALACVNFQEQAQGAALYMLESERKRVTVMWPEKAGLPQWVSISCVAGQMWEYRLAAGKLRSDRP